MSPSPPTDDAERQPTSISAENYGSALSDPVRRAVLFHLKNEGAASFDEIADVAVATAPPRPPAVDDDEERSAIENALFHLHLPKLELLGVVDWDQPEREVVLRADPERLGDWLDVSFAESVHGAIDTLGVPEPKADITVLFVEDYDQLAELVADRFAANHADITVTTASNAETALDALASTAFDCIVSDYDMPGSNGVDFLKAVRRVDDAVPFVLYTGKGTDEVHSAATDHGASAYLQKGGGIGGFDLLADRIRQVVSESRETEAAGA
jgi:CheY-like chemotaxis protein